MNSGSSVCETHVSVYLILPSQQVDSWSLLKPISASGACLNIYIVFPISQYVCVHPELK